MSTDYRPNIHDFFPQLRRGHGTSHPHDRVKDGRLTRTGNPCVNESCSLRRSPAREGEKRRGEAHLDPAANVKEWKEARRYSKDTPLEYCR